MILCYSGLKIYNECNREVAIHRITGSMNCNFSVQFMKTLNQCSIKPCQIDYLLPWVCTVIDYRGRQIVCASCACFLVLPHFNVDLSVIYYLTGARYKCFLLSQNFDCDLD